MITEAEDEAFAELEQRIQEQKLTRYRLRANIEAARFIHDNTTELGILTLRKAFEIGYLRGISNTEER